jgi:hypothetical protein
MNTGHRNAAASVATAPGNSNVTAQFGNVALPNTGACSRKGYPPQVSASTMSSGTFGTEKRIHEVWNQ